MSHENEEIQEFGSPVDKPDTNLPSEPDAPSPPVKDAESASDSDTAGSEATGGGISKKKFFIIVGAGATALLLVLVLIAGLVLKVVLSKKRNVPATVVAPVTRRSNRKLRARSLPKLPPLPPERAGSRTGSRNMHSRISGAPADVVAKMSAKTGTGVTSRSGTHSGVKPKADLTFKYVGIFVEFTPEGIKTNGVLLKKGLLLQFPGGFTVRVDEVHNTYAKGTIVYPAESAGQKIRLSFMFM